MEQGNIGTERPCGGMRFALHDAAGSWESREGSPRVRIFRKTKYGGKRFYVEFTYSSGAVYHCPLLFMSGRRYFKLFGFIRLVYDTENDVLRLSGYGDYYRADD